MRFALHVVCFALLMAAAAFAQGCSREDPGQSPKAEGAPARDRVTVGYRAYLSYAPLFIACDEGYFAEQGIDVELVNFSRTTYGLGTLSSGELDVLAGVLNAGTFNAIARGAKVRIVAGKGRVGRSVPPYHAILARPDIVTSGVLNDPERLRNLRLDVNRDNSPASLTQRALARHGVDITGMNVTHIPSAAQVDALRNGSVDLVSATEPWVTRLVKEAGAVIWIAGHEIDPDCQFGIVLYGRSLLEDRPDVGRRFMTAYLKGVRRCNEGVTPRNAEILVRHTHLDADLVKSAGLPGFDNDGAIDMKSTLAFQAWAQKAGLLDAPLAPEAFWEPRFLEAARDALAGAPVRGATDGH